MKKKLLYLTESFPADSWAEKVFVESELDALRRYFAEIVLLPIDPKSRNEGFDRMLPEGVTVDWTFANDPGAHSYFRRLPYIFNTFVLHALSGMIGEARTLPQWIKGFFQAAYMAHTKKIVRKVTAAHGMTPENTVLFSLWFNDPCGGCALLAEEEGWTAATHAHTSDLYDNRMLFRSRKLRSRILRNMRYVFTISQAGRDYMRDRYPDSAEKIIFRPLGSSRIKPEEYNHGNKCDDHPDDNKTVTFVTTARLVPIKCLDLIMRTLHIVAKQMPDMKIIWTLIGDGECRDALVRLSQQLQSPNFKIEFKGSMLNADIQRFYVRTRPDWFIMMSRSEGLPISMGEAMSHSIPIITTDVGDISELVTPECALLLPPPFTFGNSEKRTSPEVYASTIIPLISDKRRQQAMSAAALARWEEFFNASILSEQTAFLLAKPC